MSSGPTEKFKEFGFYSLNAAPNAPGVHGWYYIPSLTIREIDLLVERFDRADNGAAKAELVQDQFYRPPHCLVTEHWVW